MFCEKDNAYFICEGKRLDSSILLNGFWRSMANDETGKSHFIVRPDIANKILNNANDEANNILIEGSYGDDEEEPGTKLTLKFLRKLNAEKHLEIVAHRGGGRITDFIPASENSVELIRLASRFGATGVEIDVQLTKDGIPVLYHDANINNRLTDKPGVHGTIDDYTYPELIAKIKLKKGEKIPTLRQALETIVYQTPLQFVWLDVKDKNALEKTVALQQEFTKLALANGRKVEMIIGIHDAEMLDKFSHLPGHENIPSLCELSPEETATINALIWATLWTEGLQGEEVALTHKQGRKAFVWTVDKSSEMQEFMKAGYDGIVSNFPSLVAFYHYTTP
jgi:glycerophosphoryl diester phosphodiesterase